MPVQLNGGGHPGDDHGDEARIEIVPLIDIMFFLLASFMMVSISMTQLKRVPVNVPSASTGIAETKTPPFQIVISPEGVITWGTDIITPSEVTARLKQEGADKDARVMISADEQSRHKVLMAVMDAIRAAGVEKISFESKSPKP